MAPKRKQPESEPQEAIHPSRQFQVYGSNPKPAKKPRRTEPRVCKKQSHFSSVNTIKKRIRDVSRRLERAEDLPANIRLEDERALAAYQQDLSSAAAEKIRQKMIKRYHKVRFFERQKATRQLKKLRKRLLGSESIDEVESLKRELRVVEVDLNYTQYYPLSVPYISLYPQRSSEVDADNNSKEAHPKEKPPMWAEVEKCMENGTLDELRNRAGNAPVNMPKRAEKRHAKPKSQAALVDTFGLNRRERRAQGRAKEERGPTRKSKTFTTSQAFPPSLGVAVTGTVDRQDGTESDGGFFEE